MAQKRMEQLPPWLQEKIRKQRVDNAEWRMTQTCFEMHAWVAEMRKCPRFDPRSAFLPGTPTEAELDAAQRAGVDPYDTMRAFLKPERRTR